MQKITPCLWFDSNAEAAVNFYTSIFKNSRIREVSRYGEAGYEIHRRPAGSVMVIEFVLDGRVFTALNGGPVFKFNEAISMQVRCDSQADVDYYWERLLAGGDPKAQQCGWLKDKFGLSWQIVPNIIAELMRDQTKADRIMQAMLKMKKIDIETLKQAHEGR